LVLGGFIAIGEFDRHLVADLHGKFIGGRVDAEDGALHAARPAIERLDVVAAEIDVVDFPRGSKDSAADALARRKARGIAVKKEAIAVIGTRSAKRNEAFSDAFDNEFGHLHLLPARVGRQEY